MRLRAYLELREAPQLVGKPGREGRVLCRVHDGHPSYVVMLPRIQANGKVEMRPNRTAIKGWHPSWTN